ncbi:MAG: flavin reductase family protein [Proteobacteria bacterium]|nr:flavin reductase family protein [Pseudomonadota bacterium]
MAIHMTEMNMVVSHNFLSEALSPRLVAVVSTIGSDGVLNVAPFASTGILCYKPAILFVGISSKKGGGKKDTLRNIEDSGDFVLNVVDEEMAEPMNITATDYPKEVNEFEVSGLTAAPCEKVRSPRVKESPISFECRVMQILQFGQAPHVRSVVFGEALAVHIREGLLIDGKIDISKKRAILHFGGELYCRTRDTFELKRL